MISPPPNQQVMQSTGVDTSPKSIINYANQKGGVGARLSPEWQSFFTDVFNSITGMQKSGNTASRPTKGLWVGLPYFDTTLGYPVWLRSVNPNVWVNSTGAIV